MIKSNTIKKIVWGTWIAFASLLLLIVTYVYMVSIDAFGWFGPMVDVHTLENPKHEYAYQQFFALVIFSFPMAASRGSN